MPPVSALGQKQTFAPQKAMSALPPKADMCGATRDVRFGSLADICSAKGHVRFTPNSDRESGHALMAPQQLERQRPSAMPDEVLA